MKFSFKVFAGIFLVSIMVLAVSEFAILRFVNSRAEAEYIKQYQSYSTQIGDTLHQIDVITELLMKNAAYILREKEKEHGLPTTDELKKLRDELHMFNLYVTDNKGRYIRSTWTYPIEQERPLFTYCEDYRGLVTGQSSIERTPILRAPDLSWPFKFLMVPNHNRTRVLEASVAMDFIGDNLSNAMKPDKNVASIGLFTPNGNVLGYVHSGGEKSPKTAPFDATKVSFGDPQVSGSNLVFFTKVPATVEDCCECRTKGLTLPDGLYYYILRMEVSRATLNSKLADIKHLFLLIGLVTLILSALMAYFISRRLVHELVWMGERVNEIAKSNDWSLRLGLRGRDEVAVLAGKFDDMLGRLNASRTELAAAEKEKALVELARQLAHDIRSPLAALEVVSKNVPQLPENKRILIRAAVGRIRDIANSLLSRQRAQAAGAASAALEAASPQLLSSLIDPVVSEKRLQFRSQSRVEIELRLDASSYGLFAAVQPVEFKRLVSNLVNNAVEAFGDGAGSVSVGLASRDGRALVVVQDDGKGIPPDVLAKLGRRGETHGKIDGLGLGLHHARTCAESWGGSLELSSEIGKGTTATLVLPLAPAPEWFVPELRLTPGKAVVILDDDASIHQVWQERLDALKAGERGVEVAHVSTPSELRSWVKGDEAKARQALYLFDYELLGYSETGLSLAEELVLGERVVLVTSRYEEPEVLEGCRKLKARLIPKGLAGSVPMSVDSASPAEAHERERLDAALIDDDPLTRMVWENAASDLGKRLRTFSTLAEFFKAADGFDRATPVYVDSNLGGGVEGAEESRRIHEMGFGEIYLATGRDPGQFTRFTHLRGVIGKEPPWSA